MEGVFYLLKDKPVKVTNQYVAQLEAKGFTMKRGWDEQLVERLIECSKEEEIRLLTPRDAAERFTAAQAAQRWYETRRHVVYSLSHDELLDGIVWLSYEPKDSLGADYTLAIRLYKGARGHGLAGDFLEAALQDFAQFAHYKKGYWLDTDITNLRAQHLYSVHGFNEVERSSERITMVRGNTL
jgi:GNAT superfamily N-acetyltransferase